MIRAALQEIALFLLPFALFAIVLLLQRKNVLHVESWSRHFVWLASAGLVIVIASFLAAGWFGERHVGQRYIPPHLENGRPVPGGFE